MFVHCPKCSHRPLPADQSLPAACPSCGVILAKVAQQAAQRRVPSRQHIRPASAVHSDQDSRWHALPLQVPQRVDNTLFWCRALLLAVFVIWGLRLMTCSVAEGEMAQSFIHGPLLVFHEAGHVLFMPLGEWMTVAGGTLMQCLMPAVLGGALLWKNRDPFGASFGLWLLGVSLMDTAPYLYDALHPQLILLGGRMGEEGGHDFIFLLESLGLRQHAQGLGLGLHRLGAGVTLLALGWAGWLLVLQHGRRAGVVIHE